MSASAVADPSAKVYTPAMNKAVIIKYFTEYWGKGNHDIVS
jgi:hypothetical protein